MTDLKLSKANPRPGGAGRAQAAPAGERAPELGRGGDQGEGRGGGQQGGRGGGEGDADVSCCCLIFYSHNKREKCRSRIKIKTPIRRIIKMNKVYIQTICTSTLRAGIENVDEPTIHLLRTVVTALSLDLTTGCHRAEYSLSLALSHLLLFSFFRDYSLSSTTTLILSLLFFTFLIVPSYRVAPCLPLAAFTV